MNSRRLIVTIRKLLLDRLMTNATEPLVLSILAGFVLVSVVFDYSHETLGKPNLQVCTLVNLDFAFKYVQGVIPSNIKGNLYNEENFASETGILKECRNKQKDPQSNMLQEQCAVRKANTHFSLSLNKHNNEKNAKKHILFVHFFFVRE